MTTRREEVCGEPCYCLRLRAVFRSGCDDACRGTDRKNHEPMQRQAVPVLPCLDRDSRRLGEDRGATRYFNSQFLLPKGADFEKAAAKIYVAVNTSQEAADFRLYARKHRRLAQSRQRRQGYRP